MAKYGIRVEVRPQDFRVGMEFLVKEQKIQYFDILPHHAKTEMIELEA